MNLKLFNSLPISLHQGHGKSGRRAQGEILGTDGFCEGQRAREENAWRIGLRLSLKKDRELVRIHGKSIRVGRKISGTHIQDIGFCRLQHDLAYLLVAPVVVIVGGREAEHIGNN
jgi:hypothetical protein